MFVCPEHCAQKYQFLKRRGDPPPPPKEEAEACTQEVSLGTSHPWLNVIPEACLTVSGHRCGVTTTRETRMVQWHAGSNFASQRFNKTVSMQIASDATHLLFTRRAIRTKTLESANP